MARNAPITERIGRHIAIGAGRTHRTFLGAAPNFRSVFLHMPKCGGTSLSEAMYATVPFTERIGVIDAVATRRAAAMLNFGKDDAFLCHEDLDAGQKVFDLREAMLLQHMAWDTMLIHGHVFWSKKAEQHFGEAYKYVTLLRDPVARTISNFRMAQRAGIANADFEAYSFSDLARRHARVYLRYLTGQNDIADDEVPLAVELSKQRLQRFALVGFLEQVDDFIAQYRDLFGVKLRLSNLNVAPDRHIEYSDSQMHRIRELCEPDMLLYDFAKKLRSVKVV